MVSLSTFIHCLLFFFIPMKSRRFSDMLALALFCSKFTHHYYGRCFCQFKCSSIASGLWELGFRKFLNSSWTNSRWTNFCLLKKKRSNKIPEIQSEELNEKQRQTWLDQQSNWIVPAEEIKNQFNNLRER